MHTHTNEANIIADDGCCILDARSGPEFNLNKLDKKAEINI